MGAPIAWAIAIEPVWTADAHMVMEGAPMTVDLNGDGDAEIITAAYENLIAFDGDGKELWRFDTRGRYQTCPAIWEREGQSPLIYAGDNTGQLTCVDGTGSVVWQAETKPIFCASPALGNLDGDGKMEVVQGDKTGLVTAFDALTGTIMWQTQLEGECSSPALADLNGDGTLETVISTTAGKVIAVDAAGAPIWTFAMDGTTFDWSTCAPIVFTDSKQVRRIMCASSQQRVHCIDAKGGAVWAFTTRGAVASTLSAGDIDTDGSIDLFAVTQLGVIYRFDEHGNAIWEIDTQGRSLAPGAIVDVDGDGVCEYVLCTQNGNLLVFESSSALQFSHQFDNRTINVTPAFGDISANRHGLELAITGGESGRVFCFGTNAPIDATFLWKAYRGDNRNAGTSFQRKHIANASIGPENLGPDGIVCGDAIRFAVIVNEEIKGGLTAQAVCTRPDGSRQRALSRVTGKSGMLELPLNVTSPGTYRFAWSLQTADGNVLSRGEREIALQPFANDWALAKRAIDSLRACVSTSKPVAPEANYRAALATELNAIESEAKALASLQESASHSGMENSDDLATRTAELNARCRRGTLLAQLAVGIADALLIAFEGRSWENRDVQLQLPSRSTSPLRITRRSVVGEHEPISITLFNASNRTITPTCATREPSGVRATAFAAKSVTTNLGGTAWDPFVRTDAVKFTIPPLETREVWIDIDLSETNPGTHEITLSVESELGKTEAHITLNVLPFAMAGYDAMRMCAWAQYNEHAVEDLLAHGNTVFITSLPPATVDEASSTITVDFVALDAFLAPLKGHDVYLLLQGKPALGVDEASEAFVPRFADYIKHVLARLAENGIDETHVALYTFDEPGGNGWNAVHQYTAFAKQALKAHPGLKFYINGGADLAMFEEMAEYAGVWSPSFYMLPEQSPEMAVLRKSGKPLWSYDCAYAFSRPIGANTKSINVVAQYRLSAMVAMNYGATGIGWWCYNHGPSMWDPIAFEYPLVYTNEDGTVTTSRRWEAVREGVEDARILIALREKLADKSVSADAKGKIRKLLEETVPELSHQTMEEARLGVARYVLDATHNGETMEQLRAEMMDCVEALVR